MLSHQPKHVGHANHLPFSTHRVIASLWRMNQVKEEASKLLPQTICWIKEPQEAFKLQVRGCGHARSSRFFSNLSNFTRWIARGRSQWTTGEGAEVFRNWEKLPSGKCVSKTVSKDSAFLLLRKKKKGKGLCINRTFCIREYRRKQSP